MKTRRVGTLTAGLVLVAGGIVFLLFTLLPETAILRYALLFWPLILVALGLELLLSARTNTERKIDFGAVVIMLLCIGFAFLCEAFRQAHLVLRP